MKSCTRPSFHPLAPSMVLVLGLACSGGGSTPPDGGAGKGAGGSPNLGGRGGTSSTGGSASGGSAGPGGAGGLSGGGGAPGGASGGANVGGAAGTAAKGGGTATGGAGIGGKAGGGGTAGQSANGGAGAAGKAGGGSSGMAGSGGSGVAGNSATGGGASGQGGVAATGGVSTGGVSPGTGGTSGSGGSSSGGAGGSVSSVCFPSCITDQIGPCKPVGACTAQQKTTTTVDSCWANGIRSQTVTVTAPTPMTTTMFEQANGGQCYKVEAVSGGGGTFVQYAWKSSSGAMVASGMSYTSTSNIITVYCTSGGAPVMVDTNSAACQATTPPTTAVPNCTTAGACVYQ